MTRIKVTYRKNLAYREGDSERPRLFATLDLKGLGVDQVIQGLPIYFRRLDAPVGPVLQVYSTSLAGLPLERGNLNSLETTLDLYLDALTHFGRLPAYLVRLGSQAWPIYRLEDQLVTRYPGSPIFSGASIGELRVALADYFKLTGAIKTRKEMGVLLLSRRDLQLYEPIGTLRAPAMVDIPVFPLPDDREGRLLAPVNGRSYLAPLASGHGLLTLRDGVATSLVDTGRLAAVDQMTVRKLAPSTWRTLAAQLQRQSRLLCYYTSSSGRSVRQEIPVYGRPGGLVAARTNSLGRTTLYTAPDLRQLQRFVGQELSDTGKVPGPGYVSIRSAVSPQDAGQSGRLFRRRSLVDPPAADPPPAGRSSLLESSRL